MKIAKKATNISCPFPFVMNRTESLMALSEAEGTHPLLIRVIPPLERSAYSLHCISACVYGKGKRKGKVVPVP